MRLFNILELFIFPTIIVVLLLAIQPLLKRRVRPGIRYALWLLVVIRLIFPVAFPSVPLLAINPSDSDSAIAKEIHNSSYDSGFASSSVDGMTTQEEILEGRKTTLLTTGSALSLRGFWIIGSAIMFIFFTATKVYFLIKLRGYKERYDCDSPVPVYIMTKKRNCFLTGIFRRRIYIGQELIDKGLADFAIAHELSHAKQLDNIWLIVRNILLIAYWFHPAVWIAASHSFKDGEYSCNVATVDAIGRDKYPEYKEFVIGLSRIMPRPAFWEKYVYCE